MKTDFHIICNIKSMKTVKVLEKIVKLSEINTFLMIRTLIRKALSVLGMRQLLAIVKKNIIRHVRRSLYRKITSCDK